MSRVATTSKLLSDYRISASIRQNYIEIAALCKPSGKPVYLTKNGEGDLVVLDIGTFSRRKKMLMLREELLAVQEDRLAAHVRFLVEKSPEATRKTNCCMRCVP